MYYIQEGSHLRRLITDCWSALQCNLCRSHTAFLLVVSRFCLFSVFDTHLCRDSISDTVLPLNTTTPKLLVSCFGHLF